MKRGTVSAVRVMVVLLAAIQLLPCHARAAEALLPKGSPPYDVSIKRNELNDRLAQKELDLVAKYKIKKDPETGRVIQDERYREAVKEYQAFDRQIRQEACTSDSERQEAIQKLQEQAGLRDPLTDSGTPPGHEEYRGVFSDRDLTARSVKEVNQIAEVAARNYTVEYHEGYIKIKELDIIVWDPAAVKLNADTAQVKKISLGDEVARAHDAESAPYKDVIHQVKKSAGDLTDPVPADRESQNKIIQNTAKAAKKAGDMTGTDGKSMSLYERLKKGSTPVGDVIPLGASPEERLQAINEHRERVKDSLAESFAKSRQAADKVRADLTKKITECNENLAKTKGDLIRTPGDPELKAQAARIQQDLSGLKARENNVGRTQTMAEGVLWKQNPRLMYEIKNRVTLEPRVDADGNTVYVDRQSGAKVTREDLRTARDEQARDLVRRSGGSSESEGVSHATGAPTAGPSARMAKVQTVLGVAGYVMGGVDAYVAERDAAIREDRPMSAATVAVGTVLNITGVNQAWNAGQGLRYETHEGLKMYIDNRLKNLKAAGFDTSSTGVRTALAFESIVRGTILGTYEGAKGLPMVGDLIGGAENTVALVRSAAGAYSAITEQWRIEEANARLQEATLDRAVPCARELAAELKALAGQEEALLKNLTMLADETDKIRTVAPEFKKQLEDAFGVYRTFLKKAEGLSGKSTASPAEATAQLEVRLVTLAKEADETVRIGEKIISNFQEKDPVRKLSAEGLRFRYEKSFRPPYEQAEAGFTEALKTGETLNELGMVIQSIDIARAQAVKSYSQIQTLASSVGAMARLFNQQAPQAVELAELFENTRARLIKGVTYFLNSTTRDEDKDQFAAILRVASAYKIDARRAKDLSLRSKSITGLADYLHDLAVRELPEAKDPATLAAQGSADGGSGLRKKLEFAATAMGAARKMDSRLRSLMPALSTVTKDVPPVKPVVEPVPGPIKRVEPPLEASKAGSRPETAAEKAAREEFQLAMKEFQAMQADQIQDKTIRGKKMTLHDVAEWKSIAYRRYMQVMAKGK